MKKTLVGVSLCLSLAVILAAQGSVQINAGGATFPAPIYSKWFTEYNKLHPNIQINYQSQGSGFGISQLSAHSIDFGASDMPMNDDQFQKAGFKILHFPTVLGAVVLTYNIPGVSGYAEVSRRRRWREFFWARLPSGTTRKSPRRIRASKLPSADIMSCPPLRRQRHDLYLDGFSFQSQPGMEEQSRQQHFRELAGGPGWQGERRRDGRDQADAQFDWLRRADLRPRAKNPLWRRPKRGRRTSFRASLTSVSEAAAGAAKDMPD